MEVNRRICDELTLNVLSIELQLVNVDYGAKLYAYAFHSRLKLLINNIALKNIYIV